MIHPTLTTPFAIPSSPAHIVVVQRDADDDEPRKAKRPAVKLDWRELELIGVGHFPHHTVIC